MQLSRREALLAMLGMTATLAAPKLPGAQALASAEGGWDDLAVQFMIHPELAYLNTGALGATPKAVLQKVTEATYGLEQHPAANQYTLFAEQIFRAKRTVARFIRCASDDLVMTGGTTDGMAMVLSGLSLSPGQRVLLTSHEYARLREYWEHFSRKHRVALDVVELPLLPQGEDEVVECIKAALKPDTHVIFMSHVTSANGLRLPVAAVAEVARRHDCLLMVDGAQAVGAVPVDMQALGCDVYAASGHKWLLGPKATGFLYISARARATLSAPGLTNGYGKKFNNVSVQNLPGIIGLGAAIEWRERLGHGKVQVRLEALHGALYAALQAIPSIRLMSPPPGSALASPMIALAFRNRQKSSLAEALLNDNVAVKQIEGYPGEIDIRVGGHVYNTDMHIRRLSESLTKFG